MEKDNKKVKFERAGDDWKMSSFGWWQKWRAGSRFKMNSRTIIIIIIFMSVSSVAMIMMFCTEMRLAAIWAKARRKRWKDQTNMQMSVGQYESGAKRNENDRFDLVGHLNELKNEPQNQNESNVRERDCERRTEDANLRWLRWEIAKKPLIGESLRIFTRLFGRDRKHCWKDIWLYDFQLEMSWHRQPKRPQTMRERKNSITRCPDYSFKVGRRRLRRRNEMIAGIRSFGSFQDVLPENWEKRKRGWEKDQEDDRVKVWQSIWARTRSW